MKSIWNEFMKEENFFDALDKVNKSKNRKTAEGILYNKDKILNTYILMSELENDTYEVSPYSEFTIYEPKERVIFAPAHRDKIVQIALNNVLKPVFYPLFIKDSCGSIDGKGTHYAADKIQHNMRAAKRTWGKWAYTLKLDIKKFFYSIDREVLKSLFYKYLNDERILELLCKITDSASIMGDTGIPLGNTISQLSSNIYLNEMDQYLKRQHSLRYYVRYMDDVIIQVENKEKAREVLEDASRFAEEKLRLQLNQNKSQYYPIDNCVNAIGYKIWPTHKKLRVRSKETAKNILKTEKDPEKMENRLASWMGSAKKANSYNFIKKNKIDETLATLKEYNKII